MNIDRIVLAFAGALIVVSVLLSVTHSKYWLFLTAFVGANLFQSAFTKNCPLAKILKKFGIEPGQAFD